VVRVINDRGWKIRGVEERRGDRSKKESRKVVRVINDRGWKIRGVEERRGYRSKKEGEEKSDIGKKGSLGKVRDNRVKRREN
jgi:hypothetical protein